MSSVIQFLIKKITINFVSYLFSFLFSPTYFFFLYFFSFYQTSLKIKLISFFLLINVNLLILLKTSIRRFKFIIFSSFFLHASSISANFISQVNLIALRIINIKSKIIITCHILLFFG